jgi:hypothetical protein
MGILITLLDMASSPKNREEDSFTETLAWFLREEPRLLDCLVRLLSALSKKVSPPNTKPSIQTQQSENATDGGKCRFDLVIDWGVFRIIIEIKLRAGLGWRAIEEEGAPVKVVSQITRYLAIADRDAPQKETLVAILSPFMLSLDEASTSNPNFIGQFTWQQLSEEFQKATLEEPVAKVLLPDFLEALEKRGMTTPPIDPSSFASIDAYFAFRRSFDAMLEHTINYLAATKRISKFQQENASWQEAHNRIGYRLPPTADKKHFFFVGLHHGPTRLKPGVPDLLFFIETPPKESPSTQLQATSHAAMSQLSSQPGNWYGPTEYQPALIKKSLADIVGPDKHQQSELQQFFADAIDALRTTTLLQAYMKAIGAR